MNRWLAALVIIVCAISAPVRADLPAQDPPVPDTYKSDDGAIANKDALVGLISAEVQKLSNGADADSQSLARDWLMAEAVSSSVGYRDAYASALNDQLVTLLSNPQTSVRARVNAAIVTNSVVKSSKNLDLLPATTLLLKDKSDAVVYWAEQAGGSLVPALLNGNNQQQRQDFLSTMVQAAIDHSSTEVGGNIVELTYRVLNPVMNDVLNQNASGFSDLVDANIKLQQGRLNLYKAGIPQNAYADTFASQFLLNQNYWGSLTPAQQLQALGGMANLIRSASGYATAGGLPTGQLNDLMRTVSAEGACGMELANNSLNNPDLANAFQSVSNLGVASQPADIKVACDKANSTLLSAYPKLLDAFPNLQNAGAAQ
jgi:hypothetical protein